MRFVGTNVLLYAVSALSEDADKRLRTLNLLNTGDLALSVQVLQEFHHQATRSNRLGAISQDHTLEFIESIGHFPVQAVTLEVFRAGVAISRCFRLSTETGRSSLQRVSWAAMQSILRTSARSRTTMASWS